MNMVTIKTTDVFGADGFPIGVSRQDPQPLFPRHRHQFTELVLVTGGSGLHSMPREEYPVSAGDVFVITGSTPHQYRDLRALKLINVVFDPATLGMDRWDVRSLPGYRAIFTLEPAYRRRHNFASRLKLDMEALSMASILIDRLKRELHGKLPGFQLLATAHFMELVVFLSRSYGCVRTTESRSLLRIAEAITYIEQHFKDKITLETLASIAHMSRRTFTRAFRSAMGDAPITYLIKLRIAHAAKLIRSGDAKLTEIALDSGFSDSNYFIRQFKIAMGCTPREYRRLA